MIRVFGLLLCGALAWGQKPADADSAALLERSRQKALDYTHSLPDFVCTEVVKRYISTTTPHVWTPADTLTVKVRYSQRMEDHKLELYNGRATDRKYEDIKGVVGAGEFGGILRIIFDPESQAAFDWESWKSVRRHRVAVYQYAISAAHSPYVLRHEERQGVTGIHGVLEIDSETGELLHVTYAAYDIPKELGVESAANSVDYAFAEVGGRQYLLPARCDMEMHSAGVWGRNQIEFREYRKFSADSVIDFGTAK